MKRTFFVLFVAAMAAMSLVSCEREEIMGGNPIDGTSPSVPWYQSLVGSLWYHHTDWQVYSMHEVNDTYWDFVDDSTFIKTVHGMVINGVPEDDTVVVSCKYRYNSDSLKCTVFFLDGSTEDYYLDTVQRTLTYTFPANAPIDLGPIVFTLVE